MRPPQIGGILQRGQSSRISMFEEMYGTGVFGVYKCSDAVGLNTIFNL